MIKENFLASSKKTFEEPINREINYALLCIILLAILFIFWLIILKPIQNRYESNLSKYPAQLARVQELNKNLQNYKNSEVLINKMSKTEFVKLKTTLADEGLQLGNFSFENTNPPSINIQIKEIEFNQWLKLLEKLRKNNGLFVDQARITKGKNLGVVEVNANLVQSP
jgi:type II secretory pathway component PulM